MTADVDRAVVGTREADATLIGGQWVAIAVDGQSRRRSTAGTGEPEQGLVCVGPPGADLAQRVCRATAWPRRSYRRGRKGPRSASIEVTALCAVRDELGLFRRGPNRRIVGDSTAFIARIVRDGGIAYRQLAGVVNAAAVFG